VKVGRWGMKARRRRHESKKTHAAYLVNLVLPSPNRINVQRLALLVPRRLAQREALVERPEGGDEREPDGDAPDCVWGGGRLVFRWVLKRRERTW
jgi:hypothetical protein